ncbi:hypothetical protein [Fluviispira multicolorata]|uniref:Integral membrane protein n=1 Tax=Fluviispira multicolorata TaxID=2654512 RepID=A0A833JEF9_9BACT|nr:hypothetical protein [Fluviispira multicolorata]KAB8033186.1 hypothetical protein GCL57_00380 [Fluviispira multicolorata]
MSNKKSILVNAALTGLAVGAMSVAASANAADVKCWGVNSCKAGSSGKNKAACSVKKEDIEAVKKEKMGDKYSKASVHECGSHASCGAEEKNLNWFKTTRDKCSELGGFLIEGGKVKKL